MHLFFLTRRKEKLRKVNEILASVSREQSKRINCVDLRVPVRRVRACVRASKRASERMREELCIWRSARLVWGPRWRRSRCLTEPKGNEGEHVCPIENRESRVSPPAGRWGALQLTFVRETRSASWRVIQSTPRNQTPSLVYFSYHRSG